MSDASPRIRLSSTVILAATDLIESVAEMRVFAAQRDSATLVDFALRRMESATGRAVAAVATYKQAIAEAEPAAAAVELETTEG